MRAASLTEQEMKEAFRKLPEWTLQDGKLHRKLIFKDFAQAFGFMTTAAFSIERLNHHPEWLNVYNRVTVDLTTHDANGLNEKDFELAKILEYVASQFLR